MRARVRCRLPFAVAVLLQSLWGSGCASDLPSPDAVRRLYELSGFAVRVATTADAIQAGVAPQLEHSGDAMGAAVEERIRSAYAPELLEADLLHALSERYDPEAGAAAEAWLASEIGRRVTREALDSVTPAGGRRLSDFTAALALAPPAETRLELARRFDAASGAADFQVDLTIATAVGIASALNASLPADQRVSPRETRAGIEGRLETLRPMLRSMSTVAFLYSVRDLSDGEVARYVDFAASDAGGWYHRNMARAYLEAVDAAAERINGSDP